MVHRSLYNIVTVVVLLMSYSIPNGAQGYNISGVVNSHSIKGERLIITVSLRNRSDISLPFNKEKDIVVSRDILLSADLIFFISRILYSVLHGPCSDHPVDKG